MTKFLYGLLVVVIFLAGLAGLFYGLFIFWPPLAYIIGGLLLMGIAGLLNQVYDEGGEN